MKNFAVLVVTGLAVCLVGPAARARQQASPTMAETLAFVSTTLSEQGAIPLDAKDRSERMLDQRVVAAGDCAWRYRYQIETKQPLLGDGSVTLDLPLGKLNVKTMALRTRSYGLTVYEITIDKPAAEKTSDGDAPWVIGTVKDRETAERVAKAYVHALVMCSRSSAF